MQVVDLSGQGRELAAQGIPLAWDVGLGGLTARQFRFKLGDAVLLLDAFLFLRIDLTAQAVEIRVVTQARNCARQSGQSSAKSQNFPTKEEGEKT